MNALTSNGTIANGTHRVDLLAISELVTPGSRVLDIGCGDGQLLSLLETTRGVDGRGIEISQKGVNACVARGLSVLQGDADTDLAAYPSQVFDTVILSQTIQATRSPRIVLDHLLRIGRRVAISLPNFGYWKVRLSLLTGGRMPRTSTLDYSWWATPNIHLCTLADFVDLTRECGAVIVEAHALNPGGTTTKINPARLTDNYMGPNVFAQGAIFLLKKS